MAVEFQVESDAMLFGKGTLTVSAEIFKTPAEVTAAVRARFLEAGGQIETEQNNILLGSIPIFRIMGKAYLFGTWYGRAPVRLKIIADPGKPGASTHLNIDCDLAAIEGRFLWAFAILGVPVILGLVTKGWRTDPGILVFLPLPYVICWGNFLSLKYFLPGKLRKFFGLEAAWWK